MTDAPDKPEIARQLAAILAADVAGYSGLMSVDEEGTTVALIERREVIDALIGRYGGRIANTAGDSVIAEFRSSVEAVRAALDIQESVRTLNIALPASRQVQFRIGINVGDVIRQGDDLLGDGVNVAARLESLAPVGGICLSGEVHDQIQGKLALDFQPLGAKRLKNIGRRVRAYHVASAADGADHGGRRWQLYAIAAVLVPLLVLAGGWYMLGMRTGMTIASTGIVPSSPEATVTTSHPSGSSEIVAEVVHDGSVYTAILTWGGSWVDAERDARQRGGRLVSITSAAENDLVFDLIRDDLRLWSMTTDGQAFGPWIGLYQPPGAPEPDGGWAWVGGDPVTYLNFSDSQPNNFGGKADAVRFHNYVHQPAPFWDDANPIQSSGQGYVMEAPAKAGD